MPKLPPHPPLKTPPATKEVKVYLTSLQHVQYKLEANRRGMSLSGLFKAAIYEYIYSPSKGMRKSELPIVKIDRTPKGSKASKEKNDYRNVVKELKGFDRTNLTPVPEDEKRHVYNVITEARKKE